MKKRLLVILLSALLIVISAGCASSAANTIQTAAATQSPVSTAAATATAAQTPAPTPLTDKSAVVLTFEGATKKSMTLGEFQALAQVTKNLSFTNSKGGTTSGAYKGVHWKDLIKAIGVTKYSALDITASDSYKTQVTAAMVDDADSLFAFEKDGKQIGSRGNGYIWFCPSGNFTANYQCKYIVTIKIIP